MKTPIQHLREALRNQAIVLLERVLLRLRGEEVEAQKPYSPRASTAAVAVAKPEVQAYELPPSLPTKSHVVIPSSSENPRPLRGREKFREQQHLAACCAEHGCDLGKPDSCPVAQGLEQGYFGCTACAAA